MFLKPVRQRSAWRFCGFTACLLAILVAGRGHWDALQCIAWGRMIVQYARHDSLSTALKKTFDGRHPCTLCLQVRQGRQEEQQKSGQLPWVNPERMSEIFCDPGWFTVPPPPEASAAIPAWPSDFYSDFIESPPTPPPRPDVAVL